MLLVKKCHFFLYLDLVNIRLEIMVNYFEETKATFLTIKKQNISKSKRSHFFFQTGRTHAFGQKMPFVSLLDLIKITLQIMLSDFAEKKETFFDLKKQNFSKSKKRAFSKGLTHAFGQKMPFF